MIMSNGSKKNLFKERNSITIYLEQSEKERITKFAEKSDISVGQLAREAFKMRMAGGNDPFNKGFNQGLNEAIRIANVCEGATMMFPSGKTFAKVVSDDIEKFLREHKDE
jgi:hypothetical protein